MPPPPDEHALLWGLTWANIIAFVGILANFLWNFRNSWREKKTRRNTLALDHFGYAVRGPLEQLISAIADHMDAADDIVLVGGELTAQINRISELKRSFHATRRKLARLLTDYDDSPLINGTNWAALEQQDMDNATNALERAGRCADVDGLRLELLNFVRCLDALRTRLKAHLDNCADTLMK